MYKAEIVNGVANELYATEQALDAAIAQASSLVQTMIASRAELSVSAVAGAQAQAKAMEAIATLGQAREAIVAAHQELAKDHRRMGWGVYATGPVDKPDDMTRPIEVPRVQPDLRVA
jgi:heterodisulfide reductase subunit A-like polyferredoxin